MPRLTLTVPDKVPQPYRFSLERQIVHFGRGDDNDIQLDSGSVSSEHCVMERIIGGYVLKDLGSTNGIKLDGTRVDKISLRNGQNIEIGDVAFEFRLSDEEMTALRLEDPTSQLPPLDEPPLQKAPEPKEVSQPVVQTVDLKSPPPSEVPRSEQKPKPEPLPELPPEPQPLPDIRQLYDAPQQQQVMPQQQVMAQPQVQVMPQMAAVPSMDNGKFNKLIAVAAAVSFVTGVAMHFQNKTGQSLISAIMHKLDSSESAE